MSKLFNIVDRFIPEEVFQNSMDEIARAREFIMMMAFTQFATLFFAIRNYGKVDSITFILQVVSVVVTFLSYLLFRRTKNYILSLNITVLFVFAFLLHGNLHAGGLHSPGILWLSSMAFVAILVSNQFWSIFWAVLFASWGVFLYFAPKWGIIEIDYSLDPEHATTAKMLGLIGSTLMVSIISSVSEQNRRKNVKVLEEKNKEIQNLVRTLSHDLATPLSVLQMTGERLIRHDDIQNTNLLKLILRMEKASHHMKEIIENVRHFHAITTGKAQLQLEFVDLESVLSDVLMLFHEKLKYKNLILELKLEKNLPHIRSEKRSLLYHVLNNLISNSIKFSPNDAKIEVSGFTEGKQVVLQIRDYGIGIPEKILNILFDSNKKTTRPGTLGEVGTGFGMPLVKAYLDYFGAEIKIKSWTLEDIQPGKDSQSTGTLIEMRFGTEVERQNKSLKSAA